MTKRRILIILFSAPLLFWIISVALVLSAASFGSCEINEGFSSPCVIAGLDFGELLYSLGLFAAWGLLLVPILWGYLIVGWGAYELAVLIIRFIKRT